MNCSVPKLTVDFHHSSCTSTLYSSCSLPKTLRALFTSSYIERLREPHPIAHFERSYKPDLRCTIHIQDRRSCAAKTTCIPVNLDEGV